MATAEPAVDRRAARRARTRAEIVAAAWELVAEHGLAGLAMRDLAAKVGLKAPSLYSYVDGKAEVYDAMFREGYQAFLDAIAAWRAEHVELDGASALHAQAHLFFSFCTDDPVRFQLLFQRTIPDFEPSPESYALALEVYEQMLESFAEVGITDPAAVDVWTALTTGLVSQQLSNDPGGDRWARVVDRAVDLFLATEAPHLLTSSGRTTP